MEFKDTLSATNGFVRVVVEVVPALDGLLTLLARQHRSIACDVSYCTSPSFIDMLITY